MAKEKDVYDLSTSLDMSLGDVKGYLHRLGFEENVPNDKTFSKEEFWDLVDKIKATYQSDLNKNPRYIRQRDEKFFKLPYEITTNSMSQKKDKYIDFYIQELEENLKTGYFKDWKGDIRKYTPEQIAQVKKNIEKAKKIKIENQRKLDYVKARTPELRANPGLSKKPESTARRLEREAAQAKTLVPTNIGKPAGERAIREGAGKVGERAIREGAGEVGEKVVKEVASEVGEKVGKEAAEKIFKKYLPKVAIGGLSGGLSFGVEAASEGLDSTESGARKDMPDYWLERGIRDPEEQIQRARLSSFREGLSPSKVNEYLPNSKEKQRRYEEAAKEAKRLGTLRDNYVEDVQEESDYDKFKSMIDSMKEDEDEDKYQNRFKALRSRLM